MIVPIVIPPEISLTNAGVEIGRRFSDANANFTSVLLLSLRDRNHPDPPVQFVELLDMTRPANDSRADWKGPSFASLARENPKLLLGLVAKDFLAHHDLTFAAESLGDVPPSSIGAAIELLRRLATHPSSLVREGAVYGLSRHTDVEAVRDLLQKTAIEDVSPGVREAAAEAME